MTNDTETEATVRQAAAVDHCTGTSRNGRPCTRIAVRDTSAGFRCSHHDPDQPVTLRQARQRALRLPVTELRTPADALALSSWAALGVLRGRLNPRTAQVAKGMLAEWRQAFKDSGVLAEFDRLKETVARLSAKGAP